MERRGAVIAVIALLMVGISWPSFAVGGVVSDNAPPYYSDGSNREDFEDLRVKVLGGYVRITRRWVVDHWEWNNRWADLYLSNGQSLAEYNQEQGPQTPPTTTELPTEGDAEAQAAAAAAAYQSKANYDLFWLVRNDTAFRRASETGNTWENQLSLTLTSDDLSQYTWRDKRGSIIEYDQDGRMVGYANRFGVWVRFTRNDNGDIASIQDHHGTTVITLTYEQVPGTSSDPQYRATNLTDYTGRSVTYGYSAANGKLNNVNGVRGFDWQYQYSGDKLVAAIDPENRKTTYKFSAKGQLLSKFNADGVGVSYSHSYDSVKEEYYQSITDGEGVVTETWFDAQGSALREDRAGETQYTSSYLLSSNKQGVGDLSKSYRVSERSGTANSSFPQQDAVYVKTQIHTDGRGNKTLTTFNQYRNPIKILYANGSSASMEWDTTYSTPTKVVDERGIINEFEHDALGNLTQLTEAKGTAEERITRYTYNEFGQRTELINTGDERTSLAIWKTDYDDYGNPTVITDPLLHQTQYSDFDAIGNPRTLQDRNSIAADDANRWPSTYDNMGNVLSNKSPFNQGEDYSYNKAGEVISVTAANAAITTMTKNASGLTNSITDADAKITRFNFDKANRLQSSVDANNNSMQRQYDALGRLKISTDAEGNNTQYNYDKTLLSSINYPTYNALMNYDVRNRVKTRTDKTDNLEHLRSYGYDLGNNQNSSVDANNKSQRQVYDGLDRMVQNINAIDGVTEFIYDDRDNLLQVKDPEGRVTVYSYSLRDELQTETKQLYLNTEKQRVFTYDASGNVVSIVNPQQQKMQHSYDAANRLRKTEVFAQQNDTEPVKIINYNFNDNNQHTGYSQTVGSNAAAATADIINHAQTYTYNSLNQITNVSVDFGPFQKSYQYSYYPNGLKKTYTNPEGVTYNYFYNKNNQFAAVIIPGHGQVTYGQYDWLQPRSIMYPGATEQTRDYDGLQRPLSRSLKNSAETDLGLSNYQYDQEGNVLVIETEHGTYNYNYDDLYRLTQADYPVANSTSDTSYNYDGVGNRIAENGTASTFDDNNQLNSQGETSFSYNANGHTVSKTNEGVTTEYSYNHEERLIAVKRDGVTQGEYVYNPKGQRIRKTVDGQITWYLYNDGGLTGEYDNTGALIKEYQFKPYSPWMTEPLFQRDASDAIYYYQNDHLGKPERMLDRNGAVVWETRFDAFGAAEVMIESAENNLRFPGQYYDAESGLHHNYLRDYDVVAGRYIQSDPIGLTGGLNFYAYALANPGRYVDPTGELVWFIVGGVMMAMSAYDAYQTMTDPCLTMGEKALRIGGDIVLGAIGGKLLSYGLKGAKALMKGKGADKKPDWDNPVTAVDGEFGPLVGDKVAKSTVQVNKAAGDAARDVIAARTGGVVEQNFRVTGGLRRVDVLDGTTAIESKVGRTSLGKNRSHSRIRQELARDVKMLRSGQVDHVQWEFSRSAVTGKVGPTGPLREKLQKFGIEIVE